VKNRHSFFILSSPYETIYFQQNVIAIVTKLYHAAEL